MALSPTEAERLAQVFDDSCNIDGTLRDQLSAYATASRALLPAYGDAVDRLVARIVGSEKAPQIGDVLAPFVLPDDTGRLVSLSSLLTHGPVAVMFFRGHWCPYCRLNFRALVEAQSKITARGGQIVAIMPEVQTYTARWKARSGARFPILTDLDNGYALSNNLMIWIGFEILQMQVLGDLPAFNGSEGETLPIPATFVVGRDGVISARFVDPDYRKRMEIDDLVEAIARAR